MYLLYIILYVYSMKYNIHCKYNIERKEYIIKYITQDFPI